MEKKIDDAIIKMFEVHWLPFMKRYDSQAFREEKLYTEEVDLTLKYYNKTLRDVFKRASALDDVPDQDEIMSITEFVKFHTAVVTMDEAASINLRDLGPLFSYSMQTQIDEIYSDRYGLMFFEEFVEGMARVADKVIKKASFTTNAQIAQIKAAKNIKTVPVSPLPEPPVRIPSGMAEKSMLTPWSPAQAQEGLGMPLEEKIEEYIKLVVNHYMDS